MHNFMCEDFVRRIKALASCSHPAYLSHHVVLKYSLQCAFRWKGHGQCNGVKKDRRGTERQRDRERGRERKRDRERETERQREREREGERERERERKKERERDRKGERKDR